MNERQRLLGWREWIALPDLGIARVKAKIDTGARTSCLHAFYVDAFRRHGQGWVRFGVHPVQQNEDLVVHCEAQVHDQRQVVDSGGHREQRYVIQTRIQLFDFEQSIELTLTNRDTMRFRMLLGRTAIAAAGLYVDPASSYLSSTDNRKGSPE